MRNMKVSKNKLIILISAVIVVAVVGICLFIKYQTYDYMEISNSYENASTDNANYQYCMNGILRYSRDGIAMLDDAGQEKWNQPCQMSNPIVEINGSSGIVADKGGTSILVFTKKGLKGEIHTTKTIEKASVSSQGIVAVVLKDEETPLVMCYDSKGNVLVEHETTFGTMGYPVDLALSEDGQTMLVSYLCTEGNSVLTKIAYYYFGNTKETEDKQAVYQMELKDTIVPIVAFMKKEISVLIADNSLIFCEGQKKPKEVAKVKIESEIQSVAYDDEYVAFLLKNSETGTYKLEVYNTNGKQITSVVVDKEYKDMKIMDGQIMMYDGKLCSIYHKNGVHKYEGKVEENILEIFPISGLNKYMMINASGFHEVQLAN